jgi:hypothetical protein
MVFPAASITQTAPGLSTTQLLRAESSRSSKNFMAIQNDVFRSRQLAELLRSGPRTTTTTPTIGSATAITPTPLGTTIYVPTIAVLNTETSEVALDKIAAVNHAAYRQDRVAATDSG